MRQIVKIICLAAAIVLGFAIFGSTYASGEEIWKLGCGNPKQPETCQIRQELFLRQTVDGQEKMIGRLLNLTVVYALEPGEKQRKPYLSIQMPLGLDLRPGAVLKIDKSKEYNLKFLQCTKDGCDASIRLEPALLGDMKKGKKLQVGFRPWGTREITVVPASLSGFTKAFGKIK